MSAPQKDTVIQIRAQRRFRDTIDRAARQLGATRSEFVLSSAVERAENVLLDRAVFSLNDADWKKFTAALDKPPRMNAKLSRLLKTPSPWE